MENKKIYVITAGEYSDYHVCGVATDYERAKFIQKCHWTSYCEPEIEEFVDGETGLKGEILHNVYFVNLNNKKIWNVRLDSYSDGTRENEYYLTDDWSIQYYEDFDLHSYSLFIAYIQADTEERALKIAQDLYAKALYQRSEAQQR